ncbi:MAG: indole-3-glycerol phosphate synthase TrpC [Nitrospiraceae bacterium]|jgi:indole-3-glycerol phosphate synthase|nr:indole-3-glycerol phosphate synthase TrpC [Nitrospiraceae bacterium]
MNVLQRLLDTKKQRLDQAKYAVPLAELKARVGSVEPARDFAAAIKGNGSVRLIAELKKASPSRGLIRPDFDPVTIANIYEEHGASAISCLTEEDYFQGHLSFLPLVHEAVKLPVLRKDFIFDPYQILEARANNADAILLIAGALETNQASDYLHLSQELGMAVLFEVHNEPELDKALAIDAPIIGINNRDLTTLKINLETTFRLKTQVPADKTVVAESGIGTRDDVLRLQDAKIDAMLVGTTLMKSKDIGAKMRELLGA